jgi:hypothetical protein
MRKAMGYREALVSYDTLSIGGGNARLIEPPVTIPPFYALPSRIGSARSSTTLLWRVTPKKRGPDQCAPVISRAISGREA